MRKKDMDSAALRVSGVHVLFSRFRGERLSFSGLLTLWHLPVFAIPLSQHLISQHFSAWL